MVETYDEDLFLGYIEGDLTPAQSAQFQKTLEGDARLRNLVAQLMYDRQGLRQMPMEAAPAELMERVNQRLERRMLLDAVPGREVSDAAPVRRFRINRYLAYGGLAAMVIVGIGLIGYSLSNSKMVELATNTNKFVPRTEQANHPSESVHKSYFGGMTAAPPPPPPPPPEAASRDASSAGLIAANEARPSSAPLPTLAGQPSETPGAADTALQATAGGKSFPAGENGNHPVPQAQTQFSFPLIDDTVAKIAGRRFPDRNPPSLAVPSGSMGSFANAKALELEQLMSDSGREAPAIGNVADAQVGITLQAAHPGVSERGVRIWAIQHDVRILDAAAAAAALKSQPHVPGVQALEAQLLNDDQAAGAGAAPRLVLLMESRQISELVSNLNLDEGQAARVTPVSGSSAGATNQGVTTQASAVSRDVGAALSPYARVAVPLYIVPQVADGAQKSAP